MTDELIYQYEGFDPPEENWSKLPHSLVERLRYISTLAEFKVIVYILRHTWGYREYDSDKPITMDEFVNGRKRKDGTRLDPGVGMNEQAIRDGLGRAEEHGFITVQIDDTDKGRIKKSYSLHMKQGGENHGAGGGKSSPHRMKIIPRSEKETLDKKPSKEALDAQYDAIKATFGSSAGGYVVNLRGMIFASTKVKGEWLKCQFDPPATLEEFTGFADYMHGRMRDKQMTDPPSAAVTIQRWYYDYRAGLAKKAEPTPPPTERETTTSSPSKKYDADFQEWINKQGEPTT